MDENIINKPAICQATYKNPYKFKFRVVVQAA